MDILRPMPRMAALAFALLALACPARAGQQRRSFVVAATVTRGGAVRVDGSRLQLAGKSMVSVTIDAGPQRLVAGPVALPPGAATVTILY
jgi:ferric-dicitrate binding protein FerR (iron transport regulator)